MDDGKNFTSLFFIYLEKSTLAGSTLAQDK